MFVGKIPEASVATWIIMLAIITGVLILLLIIMALHKARILMQSNISFQHRHLILVSPYNYPLIFIFMYIQCIFIVYYLPYYLYQEMHILLFFYYFCNFSIHSISCRLVFHTKYTAFCILSRMKWT